MRLMSNILDPEIILLLLFILTADGFYLVTVVLQ
jgi:F0F1-type ATP synthase membrane subunit a